MFQGMDVLYEEFDEGIVHRRILPILLGIELPIFHFPPKGQLDQSLASLEGHHHRMPERYQHQNEDRLKTR